jgi:hypothetical protein
MQWYPFLGALVGSIIGAVIMIIGLALWDLMVERRERAKLPLLAQPLLERDLEEHITLHFAELFPGWSIFDAGNEEVKSSPAERKPSGIR